MLDIWWKAGFERMADFSAPWISTLGSSKLFFTLENVSTLPVSQGFRIVWLKLRISRALYS